MGTDKLVKTRYEGIFQKGNRHQVRYRYHGRQVAKSFRTLSEARRFKGQVDAGETQPTSAKSFKVYADEWIDSYSGRTANGISDSTRDSYRDALKRFAKPFFGTVPLDRIDPPLVRSYIAHLESKGLAPASARRMYAPVRALLATAYEDGLIKINPTVRVIVADHRPAKPRWLTVEQTKALLEQIPAAHADLVYVLATTGLRISEALSLRWEDLTLIDGQPSMMITRSKTAAGERIIPLTPEAMRRLTKRRASADFSSDQDFIFPAKTGVAMDPRNFRHKVFKPAAVRASVPWGTPHKLRHGVATLMASRGLSAAQIAAFLGHADGGVLALKTYIHADVTPIDFMDSELA